MRAFTQLLMALGLFLPLAGVAKPYPDHPIRLIVPYAAGGGADTAARMLAQELTPRLKQTIIVENKAGAATQIGTAQVVRAKPDGYTLLMGTANLATNIALYDNLAPAYGQVKAGRIKPLAIAAKQRSLTFPDIPTLEELGYPVQASSWWGVMAPAGTPQDILTKLNTEIQAVVAEPKVRDYFVEQGMNPVGGSPQQFSRHIAAETEKWRQIVKDADIKIGN